jgi:hypothetical protein
MEILVAVMAIGRTDAKKPPQFVAEAACGQSLKING